MPTALVIRCKLCISQPNAWQHQDVSVMVHRKPNILHLREITVKERGRFQLHNCCLLLYHHTFYYFMSSPITLTRVSNRDLGPSCSSPCWLQKTVFGTSDFTGMNEWGTAHTVRAVAVGRCGQAPQSKLTLVSHWISFSFLSRASALCLSSSLCLASVAASISLIFKLKVTSFQRLKKKKRKVLSTKQTQLLAIENETPALPLSATVHRLNLKLAPGHWS